MGLGLSYESLPPQIMALVTPVRLGLGLLDPEASMDIRAQLRSRVARDGKFTKLQVLYLPVTPILPVAWFYECSTCEFYLNYNRAECEIVEGVIEPYAWCGLWINRREDQPFSWVARALSVGETWL